MISTLKPEKVGLLLSSPPPLAPSSCLCPTCVESSPHSVHRRKRHRSLAQPSSSFQDTSSLVLLSPGSQPSKEHNFVLEHQDPRSSSQEAVASSGPVAFVTLASSVSLPAYTPRRDHDGRPMAPVPFAHPLLSLSTLSLAILADLFPLILSDPQQSYNYIRGTVLSNKGSHRRQPVRTSQNIKLPSSIAIVTKSLVLLHCDTNK